MLKNIEIKLYKNAFLQQWILIPFFFLMLRGIIRNFRKQISNDLKKYKDGSIGLGGSPYIRFS